MNYHKLYYSIIEKRRIVLLSKNVYSERHHIKPIALGGNNSKENIVKLTAREHFICHYLLTKMYPKYSNEWYKMTRAFLMMSFSSSTHQRYVNSFLYTSSRENFSISQTVLQTGENNSMWNTMWIYNLELKLNTRIKKTEEIPIGWTKGRIYDFDKLKNKKVVVRIKTIKYNVHSSKVDKKEHLKKLYTEYYKIYNKYGWEKFKEMVGYKYTKQNLTNHLCRHVDDFVPQNGKMRGL